MGILILFFCGLISLMILGNGIRCGVILYKEKRRKGKEKKI